MTARLGRARRRLAYVAAIALALWPGSLGPAALASGASPQPAAGLPSAPDISSANCPPLSPPSGTVVNVSTEPDLQAAVGSLAPNTTILIADGMYHLTQPLPIRANNVAIRGASGNRDAVVLTGGGMTNVSGHRSHIFQVFAANVTIADLTAGNVFFHPVQIHGEAGATHPTLYNLHLVDAGEQFVKGSTDGVSGLYSDNGLVACSTIEYTTYPLSDYTNGVDVLAGAGWIIRDNVFRNIRSPMTPGNHLAGPAVLMWGNSLDTIVERNLFIECDRAVALGLGPPGSIARGGETTYDHQGGIVRNNFIYRAGPGDVGITLNAERNGKVYNNTVILNGTFPWNIEYRFSATSADIRYNLSDGPVLLRDGATGTEIGNIANAQLDWFVNPAAGDLHLTANATPAIDHAATLADVPDDYDGDPRPIGPAPDVGADEYGVAPPWAVTDLRLAGVITTSNVLTGTLMWTAPGNALTTTVRYSASPITPANWPAALPLGAPLPGTAHLLNASLPYTGGNLYFALKSANAGGESALSNLAFWPERQVFLPLLRR